MAASLNSRCPSCGNLHRLFLPDADIFSDLGVYEFICPSSGETARVSPTAYNEVVQHRPAGSVEVRKVNG